MTDSLPIRDWREQLALGTPGLHLVDPTHPLQVYVGATDQGAPRMVIRSVAKPVKPALSQVVLVERYEDQTGRWNVSFTLQNRQFDEVFLRLADDVLSRSAGSVNEVAALDRVGVVFDEWRRLLKARPNGLLSMEELRGLIGELWMLLGYFSDGRSLDAAVAGWLGPLGLPQDFWYPEDGYHEVKAIGPATTRVRISSEYQLDASPLELVILLVGGTNEQTIGAVNLPALVNRVMARLFDEGSSHEPFAERLARLGVDLHEGFYHETWFVVTRLTGYGVGDSFPAIRASALPLGVERVTYQIDVTSLEEFKIHSTEVA